MSSNQIFYHNKYGIMISAALLSAVLMKTTVASGGKFPVPYWSPHVPLGVTV